MFLSARSALFLTFGWLAIISLLAVCCESLAAPPGKRGTPPGKRGAPQTGGKTLSNQLSGFSIDNADPYAFDLSSAVYVLSDTTDLDLYDPLTLATLQRLKDESAPAYDQRDLDPAATRHAVEKAFSIQAGRSLARLIRGSELAGFHRDVLKSVEYLKGIFSFAVARDHTGVSAGQDSEGKKLFVLSFQMSVRNGFDPQLRLSDSLRLRYDLSSANTFLEYSYGF